MRNIKARKDESPTDAVLRHLDERKEYTAKDVVRNTNKVKQFLLAREAQFPTMKDQLKEIAETSIDYITKDDDINSIRAVASMNENDPTQYKDYGIVVAYEDEKGGRHNTEPLSMTRHAKMQMAEKLGIPFKYLDYMEDKKKWGLVCQNINAWVGEVGAKTIRTTGGTIRAVLSDRYLPISNWDLVRIAHGLMTSWNAPKPMFDEAGKIMMREDDPTQPKMDVCPNPAKVYECDISDTSMHLKFISEKPIVLGSLKDGSPDISFGGIAITNSEVGASSYLVEPFMLRLVCENGLVAPRSIKQIHLGAKMEAGIYKQDTHQTAQVLIAKEFRDIFDAVMHPKTEFFTEYVNAIRRSKAIMLREFGDVQDVAKAITRNMEVRESEIDEILKLVNFGDVTILPEDQGSQWALGNAITSVANTIPNMERKIELQRIGFEVLTSTPEILLKAK